MLALQQDVAGAIAREIRATLATDGAPAVGSASVDPARPRSVFERPRSGLPATTSRRLPRRSGCSSRRFGSTRRSPKRGARWPQRTRSVASGVRRLARDRPARARGDHARARAGRLELRSLRHSRQHQHGLRLGLDGGRARAETQHRHGAGQRAGAPELMRCCCRRSAVFPRRWRKASSSSGSIPLRRSLSALGRAQYRARQFDAAIVSFNQAIALDRTYVPNYARLADVYHRARPIRRCAALAG